VAYAQRRITFSFSPLEVLFPGALFLMKSRTFPGKWVGHELSQEREQNRAFDALIQRLISAEERGYIDG